ncbi:hypothetical protein GCM10012319_32210 [Comamonas sp. KCTC 72670]|nr:hypothetical protein GCM10012319_32210 [Comamonas sp. KCTC 72670]
MLDEVGCLFEHIKNRLGRTPLSVRPPLNLNCDATGSGEGSNEDLHRLQLQVWRFTGTNLQQRRLTIVTT